MQTVDNHRAKFPAIYINFLAFSWHESRALPLKHHHPGLYHGCTIQPFYAHTLTPQGEQLGTFPATELAHSASFVSLAPKLEHVSFY